MRTDRKDSKRAIKGSSKRNWAVSLLAASAPLLMREAGACVQVSLTSVENTNGVITDYQTNEDEIYTWFGVGEYFLFTYRNDFRRNQKRTVDPALISMPCFHDDVFYIDMTEQDDFVNEKSQIVMACKNF